MVRRTRNGRTGQVLGETGKTCPPQANPARAPSAHGFKRWESLFDAELKKPATRIAWRTLRDHHCDPFALKSSLFYAAYRLKDAQEVPQAWEAFDRARETTLSQVAQLKKVLRGLLLLQTQGRQVASDVLWLWGVKNKDVSFFQGFPGLLERFESVLKVLYLPSERRDTFQDWLIASGELLLHLYVKEITGKLFTEETSVLLEASAVCCGFGHGREYSTEEAVSRRYRRWFQNRKNKNSDYVEIRRLVEQFGGDGNTFLKNVLDARLMQMSLEVSLHQFVATGTDPFKLFRRVVLREQTARR
jgi:hypothetical protein